LLAADRVLLLFAGTDGATPIEEQQKLRQAICDGACREERYLPDLEILARAHHLPYTIAESPWPGGRCQGPG
jgi:hypothetical protein